VYNGVWGKAPEAGEFSRIFVLKVTMYICRARTWRGEHSVIDIMYCMIRNEIVCKVCRFTFNCKLQKKLGQHDASCTPNNFVGGATARVAGSGSSYSETTRTEACVDTLLPSAPCSHSEPSFWTL